MKKLLISGLVLALMLSFAIGCGGGEEEVEIEPEVETMPEETPPAPIDTADTMGMTDTTMMETTEGAGQ